MKPLTCAAARRRLHAFYDRELTIAEQIAVAGHLDWCGECAALLADFEDVGTMLRAASPGRTTVSALSRDDSAGFSRAVVNRMKAEHDASFAARVHGMFEDLHLVYAGLGAAVATMATIVVVAGMTWLSSIERVTFPPLPGSNENPFAVDARMMMPRGIDMAVLTGGSGERIEKLPELDAVVALSAVVTREGRVAKLELLDDGHDTSSAAAGIDDEMMEGMIDAASRARFEPALKEGQPVAVNMVWLVAHTTVRASKHRPAGLSATPGAKKRVAFDGIDRRRPAIL